MNSLINLVAKKLNRTKDPNIFVIFSSNPLFTKPRKGAATSADDVMLCAPPTNIFL